MTIEEMIGFLTQPEFHARVVDYLMKPETRMGLIVITAWIGLYLLKRLMEAIERANDRAERRRLAHSVEIEERRYRPFFDGRL